MGSITSLEMVDLYVNLTREYHGCVITMRHSSSYMKKYKKVFVDLKKVLDEKGIPIKDYMVVQFMSKGHRIYPNQLKGKAAMDRWEEYKRVENIREIFEQQERYLNSYLKQDYTLEEALSFDVFFYWFRCIKMKDCPRIWKFYAKRELRKIPGLDKILKKRMV